MSWIENLKSRWNLQNTFQVIIVLIVFACTGFTVLFIKKPLFYLLGIENKMSGFGGTMLYLILILPAYQAFLLLYGFIFGQFRFFWEFEKKTFKRIINFARKK